MQTEIFENEGVRTEVFQKTLAQKHEVCRRGRLAGITHTCRNPGNRTINACSTRGSGSWPSFSAWRSGAATRPAIRSAGRCKYSVLNRLCNPRQIGHQMGIVGNRSTTLMSSSCRLRNSLPNGHMLCLPDVDHSIPPATGLLWRDHLQHAETRREEWPIAAHSLSSLCLPSSTTFCSAVPAPNRRGASGGFASMQKSTEWRAALDATSRATFRRT